MIILFLFDYGCLPVSSSGAFSSPYLGDDVTCDAFGGLSPCFTSDLPVI